MCYSIVLASYKGDKKKEPHECANIADEKAKVNELEGRDQIAKLTVYRCHRNINLSVKWVEELYDPTHETPTNNETKEVT